MSVLRGNNGARPVYLAGGFASALVALAAWETRRVFDSEFRPLVLLIGVAVAGAVAAAVTALIWQLRALAYLLATIAIAAVITAVASAPRPVDVVDAMTRAPIYGFGDIAAAVWPSPTLAPGVAAFALLIIAAASVSVDCALRRRSGAALLPPLLVLGVVALLSAEAGAPSLVTALAFVLATLGLLRAQQPRSHSNVSRGFTVGMVAIVGAVPFLAAALTDADRYDPRSNLSGRSPTASGISPLARVNLWRAMPPETVMFRTDAADTARWRLVALTRFDGRDWLPADDYRVSGSRVRTPEPTRSTVATEVIIGDLDAPWLPAPDLAMRVSRPVEVDAEISGLLVEASGIASGDTYRLVTQPRPLVSSELRTAQAAAGSVFTESFQLPPSLIQLAQTITATATSDADRAERIANYLREGFVLDPTSAPGHSLAVTQVFLETTRRGADEQFVSAFALLAAADGLAVRVSVGFDTVPDSSSPSSLTVARASDAIAWPEVKFDGLGWVAFDPVPAEANQQAASPVGGTPGPIEVLETPAPPATVPAVVEASAEEPVSIPDPAADAAPYRQVNVRRVVLLALAAAGLLAALVYVVSVLAVKQRRQQRRAQHADPRERVLGAFRSGVDVLVDLGTPASTAHTDRELVLAGARVVDEAARTLAPVARAATAAVFAPELVIDDGHADEAWQRVHAMHRQAAQRVGWRRALRARLSVRSLRRGLPDR